MGSFGVGGAGLDVGLLVQQILFFERAPVRLWQAQESRFDSQGAAFRDINDKLLDLEEKINALKDLSGKFNSLLATSSSTTILTATADSNAVASAHTVQVTTLAQTSTYVTGPLTDADTAFSAGSFDLQIGAAAPTTITVTAGVNDTINTLASHINGLGLGVTAGVIIDANGARLSILSDTSGLPGDLTVSSNTTGLVFTETVLGTNGSLTVDGIAIENTGNTVSTVIPGVTLNLLSAAPGTNVTVTVENDTEKAREAIDEFVTSYNSVVQAISTQFTYNSVTKQGGVLSADSTLRSIQQRLLTDATYSITGNNGFVNLASIGVDLSNDGTLTVNDSELDAALASNFTDVQNFFQLTSPTGFARNFSTNLTTLTDSITTALNGIDQSKRAITDQIEAFEVRLELREQQLIQKFSRVDAILRQLPLLQAQISNQLNSLR